MQGVTEMRLKVPSNPNHHNSMVCTATLPLAHRNRGTDTEQEPTVQEITLLNPMVLDRRLRRDMPVGAGSVGSRS